MRCLLTVLLVVSACTGGKADNRPPSTPVIALGPADATTLDDLVVSIVEEAEDPEGERVTYSYEWVNNGLPQADLADDVVSAALTQRDETWQVFVTATDGSDSAPAVEAAVAIANSAPSAMLDLTPADPSGADDLVAVVTTTDADDDDVLLTWSWTRDGEPTEFVSDRVPASATEGGQVWRVVVTPDDGSLLGTPAEATAAIGNVAPELRAVTIEPSEARSGDTVTAVVEAYDADGDDLIVDVVWTVDGAVAGAGDTLSLVGTVRGEAVVATAVASDSSLSSDEVASEPLLVANTPPSITAVALEPLPLEERPTECTPDGWSDLDGDAEDYQWSWYVNDVLVSDTPRLNGTGYDKGDRVRCEATPFDGFDLGSPVASLEVVVANTPPVLLAAAIHPLEPTSGSTLSIADVLTRDDDGDDVVLQIRWIVDGVEVHVGETLEPSFFALGDLVRAEVSPFDGDDLGAPMLLDAVEIVNGRPEGAVPGIEPVAPTWGVDDLHCVLSEPAVDPDGDPIDYRAVWRADGVLYAGTDGELSADTIPAHETTHARTWSCAWVAGDLLGESPASDPVEVEPTPAGGNLILLVADDVGTDKVGAYGEHAGAPPTPNIDMLAEEGVLFRNAYSQPTCSPTRAAMLTGRFPERFGLNKIIDNWEWTPSVPDTEVMLPRMLAESPDFTYVSSLTGKWHLGTPADGFEHPANAGFGWHAGSLGNLRDPAFLLDSDLQGYSLWEKNTNGSLSAHEVYATTDTVDDAISQMHRMPEPWILYVAFNAPHTPLHVPPADLHGYDDLTPASSDHDMYQAMVEALDTEIGRLLDNIPAEAVDDTHVIFMGDNGTPKHAITEPFDPSKGKGSVWEGGINVPLVVRSPLVARAGTESGALVHAVDVFATAGIMAGVDLQALTTTDDRADVHPVPVDGQSLLPYLSEPERPGLRDTLMVSRATPNGPGPYMTRSRAITDGRWKLIIGEDFDEDPPIDISFFDLDGEVVEREDLTDSGPLEGEAAAAYDRLMAELEAETDRRVLEIPPLAPDLEGAVVEPAEPERGEPVTCIPLEVRDPNYDEVTFRYEWWLDGELSDVTDSVLSGDDYGEAAEVTCLVFASDGIFETEAAPASVVIGGDGGGPDDGETPSVTAVLGPGGPTEADIMQCYAVDVFDPNGDDVTLSYSWRVDLAEVPDYDAPTLDGSYFDRGDGIRCSIIASDGVHESEEAVSNRVVVANFVPTPPVVEISPAEARPGEPLVCTLVEPSTDLDPGDDLTHTVRWSRDGVPFDDTATTVVDGDTIPAGVTGDGEAWACTVTATDGLDDSPPASDTRWVWEIVPEVWPTGLDDLPPNTTCLDPGRPASDATVQLLPAFDLSFALDEPTYMTYPPGDDSWWYALLQDGRVVRWVNSPDTSEFEEVLDFSEHVRNIGAEQGGALGLAFHPDFALNGEVYVSYTAMGPGGVEDFYSSRLSRFMSFDGGRTIDPESEEILLDIEHRYIYHNGGHLEFGPEGYLWFALGDGGGVYDADGHGGNPHTLFSTLMRLDVDTGFPYAIPPDNPFADGIGGAPEVWAYGFRNPWRYTIDWPTGEIWLGDVGANTREEISLVERGGHHGWATYEGNLCLEDPCEEADLVMPVVDWEHVGSAAAIGGLVYRGSSLPELYGTYLYTDYYGGTPLMGITRTGPESFDVETLIPSTGQRVASFAQDLDGEVYLIDHVTGEVLVLAPADEAAPDDFPQALSETGCVDPDDPTIVADVMVPYGVSSQLWSDGALKKRYLALPDGATISVGPDGDFELPIGAVTRKDFRLDGRFIETRLMFRHADGEWGAYTYRWEEDQSDAYLVDQDGLEERIGDQLWYYPARGQCFTCHTEIANRTLGVEALQLNHPWTYPDGRVANQIDTLNHLGLLEGAPSPAALPSMPSSEDPTATWEERASSYLHANCAYCHVEGGTGAGPANFHYLADDAGVCDVIPYGGDIGLGPDARLLAPGDPDHSVILARMLDRGEWAMPPLSTFIVDPHGTEVVRNWILETESCD